MTMKHALLGAVALAAAASSPVAVSAPDVTFCQLYGLRMADGSNRVGDVVGLTLGTTSWNVGDQDLEWFPIPDERHPYIAMNLYRATDNGQYTTFEQVGQSWCKHGFFALASFQCDQGGLPNCVHEPGHSAGDWLGIGCTDTYDPGLNDNQSGLGPRFEINPWTGDWDYTTSVMNVGGVPNTAVTRRLQVHDADLDPALNPGATYYAEGYYVQYQDENHMNSAAWRGVTSVSGTSGGNYTFGGIGSQGVFPNIGFALDAWTTAQQTVIAQQIPVVEGVSPDGRAIVGAEATDLGNGFWHYEYAVLNVDMDRQVDSFTVPFTAGTTITNIDFHAVEHHDEDFAYMGGPAINNNPWTVNQTSNSITWSTTTNPIRWGTLYNFRFDANVPPGQGSVTLGQFKSGAPTSLSGVSTVPSGAPADCNGNGTPDADDIANGTSLDCNGNSIPDECEGPCDITLQFVAGGLASPVYVTSEPGDASRLYVLEQNSGRIRLIDNGVLQATPFLDIGSIIASGGERGLLCMAFHPDYASNGYFYVYYTNTSGNSALARYSVSGNPDLADAGSALIMKTVSQDFSNHNGGTLAFGPDGMLYWSLGDGGSGGDPNNRAQDPQSLLGKMLRLDVDASAPYIPGDNPFVGDGSTLNEIWALGLRNPWRFSFDWLTGDMYIGDVGQNAREELNFEPAFSGGGYNWGWRCYEGNNTYNLSGCGPIGNYEFPFLDYATGVGGTCTVVGGYVYRGCDIPGLSGTYFYADYCAGWIRSLRYDPGTGTVSDQLDRTSELGFSGNPVSFGQDADGELYIVSITGSVYKIVPDDCGGPGIIDCNNNGIDDAIDISSGTSQDCNANGIPDECESAGGLKNYTSSPNVAIPDGTGAFVSDTINVSESGTIQDVNVNLDIDHTWNGDLIVRLTHNGTTVVLVDRPGQGGSGFGFDNDGFDITLDDKGAGGPIEDADSGGGTLTSPPSYTPQEALSSFDGMDKNGDWIIEVSDNADQDTGSLVTWSLDITNEGGGIDPCIEDCNDNGIADELDISSGNSEDCNLNGIPDECEGMMGGGTKSYSSKPALSIPDGGGAGGIVTDSIVITESGTINDLDVELLITHTWNGDIWCRLSHNGTSVVLIDRPNFPESQYGFDDDGFDITLDDKGPGGNIDSTSAGGGTLTSPPSYTPQEALSAFDGMDKAGTWTIEIADYVGADAGTLDRWSLVITTPVTGGGVDCTDCNMNGIDDAIDISMGLSLDCNANGVPDECDIADGTSEDCDGGPVGDPGAGEDIILSTCQGCHNIDGSGGMGFPGPNIRNKSRVEIWNMLLPPTTHPGGAHPEYTQQDFADLEAFLSDTGGRGRPDGIPDECQGPFADCDMDGTSDGCELDAGTQQDLDHNGIPDDCEMSACPGDADGDNDVDFDDLNLVLLNWGTAGPTGDVDDDGDVDFDDLNLVLLNWLNTCP